MKLGPAEVKLPLQIKGGSTYELILKANIVVPEVNINLDKVDFGKILLGHCKITTIQLSNNKEVKCDWSIGYGVAAKSSKV